MKPPANLSAASRTLWREILNDYELMPSDLRVLQCALEALDQYRSALAVLKKKGNVYLNRFDEPRPRPEVAIARDARLAYLRSMRELGLDAAPFKEESARPPALRSIAGGRT